MACAGDTPTRETLAAVSILSEEMPQLKIRVVNVVDLFKLHPKAEHPHGLTDAEYDMIFTRDKPIIFAFHGYPTLIHELTYRRHNHHLHVRGYKEEGPITTPFDMRVQNDIDRFHLVEDVLLRVPQYGNRTAHLFQKMEDKLVEHKQYIHEYVTGSSGSCQLEVEEQKIINNGSEQLVCMIYAYSGCFLFVGKEIS